MTLSASHRDLDLDVLEQLSSGAHSVGRAVVADSPDVTGCVVLATCNRFEVYLDTAWSPATDDPVGTLRDAVTKVVASSSGMTVDDVAASLQTRTDDAVARHLFAVGSGLDSMVVGEREVAGQVRRALAAARADGTTTPRLERLFQVASRTARAVGARTGLGSTGRSVVGVALDLVAADVDLAASRVLLIGTGSYAGASLTALRARGVTQIAVHSPSGRGEVFAADRGLAVVGSQDLLDELARTDVVVSCSGALGPVVDARTVRAARERAAGPGGEPRPTVLVDLALQHDIEPAAGEVPGVRLIDLSAVQRHSPTTVSPEVAAGRAIVEDAVEAFRRTLAEADVTPAVVALRRHVDAEVAAEVARVRARGADDATVAQVERSVRRIAARLLHGPTVRAREHAREGRPDDYLEAFDAVFGRDLR